MLGRGIARTAAAKGFRSRRAALTLVALAALSTSSCIAWISPCAWTKRPDEQPFLILQGSSGLRWLPGGRSQAADARLVTEVWSNGYLRNLRSPDHSWCRTLETGVLVELEAAVRDLQVMARELDAAARAREAVDAKGEFMTVSFLYGARFVHGSWASSASSSTSPRVLDVMDTISCSLERSLSHSHRRVVQSHFDDYLKARGRVAPCSPERD